MKNLQQQFNDAMIDIYQRAKKECKYNASRFLQVVTDKGGVDAAHSLIQKEGGTEGFIKLWELHRLDLSAEVLVLKDEFRILFTDMEREQCRDRLGK
ncbi:hypothetical protein [Dehalobacter sp. TeCB1]|uniref:hypothetical protein n=1 Tax=Dehalobacter sp. TeCB1 TaxID=1843715 RepID=UPI00083A50DA|nr:hypothetical protein [Dehalobacter sp. TeCB1]OCZ54242.1 hypothetical protein A7D23_05585 [Dehalobacter sp. TeCB1]